MEYVSTDDAAVALTARYAFEAAIAAAKEKQVAWELIRARIVEKYGINIDAGEGWDPTPDGKLKVRRTAAK